jgi:hypothetical protein
MITEVDPAITAEAVTVTMNAKAFAGLLTDMVPFTCKNSAYSALTAVQLRPGVVQGSNVVVARATDRYSLAEAWAPIPEYSPAWPDTLLIPASDVRPILAALRGHGYARFEVLTGGPLVALTVRATGGAEENTATVYCPSDEFPQCDRLWPAEPVADVTQCFARDALVAIAAVAKRRKALLRMDTYRSNVVFTVGEDFRVLVMKTRTCDIADTYIAP